MSDQAIATEALTKRYRGDVLAVDGVNLRVARGEIYAFLGLNGAGKSTTIRMLLGMIKPTAGHADLFGIRVTPGANDLWRRVGHLVESATAYPELTVVENLDVARRLAGIEDRGRVDRMIERLALGAYAGRRAGTLSLGNLQRLALARALLHGPELLILDEPANGLDGILPMLNHFCELERVAFCRRCVMLGHAIFDGLRGTVRRGRLPGHRACLDAHRESVLVGSC
jgi:ABC-2 type transport system ATP-binding protein